MKRMTLMPRVGLLAALGLSALMAGHAMAAKGIATPDEPVPMEMSETGAAAEADEGDINPNSGDLPQDLVTTTDGMMTESQPDGSIIVHRTDPATGQLVSTLISADDAKKWSLFRNTVQTLRGSNGGERQKDLFDQFPDYRKVMWIYSEAVFKDNKTYLDALP